MNRKRGVFLAIAGLIMALLPSNLSASNANPAVPVSPTFTDVTSGSNHSCGITTTKEIYCWGDNDVYQLGTSYFKDNLNPNLVYEIKNAASIFAGARHSCAILADGLVKCWGDNRSGQVGDGRRELLFREIPVFVHNLFNPVSLALGDSHSCALMADGSIRCWGENTFGQLGDGTNTNSLLWVQVKSDRKFKSVAAGAFHTCAVDELGDTYCWGKNDSGQLGSGNTRNSNIPRLVIGIDAATSVAANFDSTCAIVTRGATWCWGNGKRSVLGNFDSESKSIPVAVVDTAFLRSVGNYTPVSEIKQISIGETLSCLISKLDSVACWGESYSTRAPNFVGQSATAGVILSVSKIAVGRDHACALRKDGSIYCWGRDDFGEFGVGSVGTAFSTSTVPVGYWTAAPLDPKVEVNGEIAVVTWSRTAVDYDPVTATNLTVTITANVNNGEFTCAASTSPTCQFGPLKSNSQYEIVLTTSNTKRTTERKLNLATQTIVSLKEKRDAEIKRKEEEAARAKAAEEAKKIEDARLAKEAADRAAAKIREEEEAKRQAEIKAQQAVLIGVCNETNAKGVKLREDLTKTVGIYKWSDYEAPFVTLLSRIPAIVDCPGLRYDLDSLKNTDWGISQVSTMHDFLRNQADIRLKAGGITFNISCVKNGVTKVVERKTQTCPKGSIVLGSGA